MAKPTPKDIQLYVLVGLVVLVVGIGGKAVLDATGSAPATPPPPPGATPAVAGVAAAPTSQESPGAGDAYVLGGRDRFAGQGRDPFTPVPDELIAKVSEKIAIAPPSPSPTPPSSSGRTYENLRRGLIGLNHGAMVDKELRDLEGTTLPPAKAPEVRVLTPPLPPYTVSGIIIGEPGGRDVAILKRDGVADEKKFVVVGDPLEGGFTVIAIESGGVVVKHPGRPTTTVVIPGAASIPVGNTGAVYHPKQTTIVPATTATLPLTSASPAAPTSTTRVR